MTKQEIFNKVWAGLSSQGFKQSMCSGSCAYRGADGRKCAVGHLIADEHYQKDLEGSSVGSSSFVREVLEASGVSVSPDVLELLVDCQWAHDCDDPSPSTMRQRLGKAAQQHGLSVPEPVQLELPGVL